MFDFDDNFILDGNSLPWLIWIQILVMFLLTLTILLSFFDFFTLDSSSSCEADSLSLLSSSITQSGPPLSCSQTTMVVGNHNVKLEANATTVNKTSSVGNYAIKDGSFAEDLSSAPIRERRLHHPCHFFDFAKQAFLKCFGLGSRSPKPPHKEHED